MAWNSGTLPYPAHQGVLYCKQESGAYPYASLPAAPSITAADMFGIVDLPDVVSDEGSETGGGIGSAEPLYDKPGTRTHTVTINNVKITNVPLLVQLINGSAGAGTAEGGTPDFMIAWGATAPNEYLDRVRFAKLNSITLAWQEGSAAELTASLEFWAIAREDNVTARSTDDSELQAYGTPLTWHNLVQVDIAGGTYRDQLMSLNFTKSFGLERKCHGIDDDDDNSLSRTSTLIMPHNREYGFSFSVHSPRVASALVDAAPTSTLWSTTNAVAIQAVNADHDFNLAIAVARLRSRRGPGGGDRTTQMSSEITAVIRNVTASGT